MGWLRLIGSLKLQGSFAKELYSRDCFLQKRPIILRSLLIVATQYRHIQSVTTTPATHTTDSHTPCIYCRCAHECISIDRVLPPLLECILQISYVLYIHFQYTHIHISTYILTSYAYAVNVHMFSHI